MEAILKSPGDAASIPAPTVAPLRTGETTVRALADLYLKSYEGRDTTRISRISFWIEHLGDMAIKDVLDDHVQHALDILAVRKARYFVGKDADGNPVFKSKGKTPSGATLNRHLAAFSSLCSWANKKRMLPRGWVNPCSTVEKHKESQGRLRFLDQGEIDRLLVACRQQKWSRLYLVVLLALTTGCRRGELERLTWADIDFDSGLMSVNETKNGQPRIAPLTDSAIEELRKHVGKPGELVFFSKKRPDVPFNFTLQWQAALKAAGIRGFVFHGLRHTSASVLCMSGATLHDVGQVLGHKTIGMSARYSHLSVAHKRKVVAHGLGAIK